MGGRQPRGSAGGRESGEELIKRLPSQKESDLASSACCRFGSRKRDERNCLSNQRKVDSGAGLLQMPT